jgi:hypothetical protein
LDIDLTLGQQHVLPWQELLDTFEKGLPSEAVEEGEIVHERLHIESWFGVQQETLDLGSEGKTVTVPSVVKGFDPQSISG